MRGRRIADEGMLVNREPGAFGRVKGVDGAWHWYATAPNGLKANLSAHTVTEHKDGTISVEPSILVSDGQGASWHGYLDEGAWRAC